MKKIYSSAIAILLFSAMVQAQSFTNTSGLLPGTFHSGGVTGVTDMNNDGLDDMIIMDQSTYLYIAYQQPNGSFTLGDFGSVSSGSQWGMCLGDVDNDGQVDVLSGGNYDGVHLININGIGDYIASDPQNVSIFMQGCNFADIDNDGWLDAFACHDDGESYIFQNDGNGTLGDGNGLIDYTIYPNSDNSGNYGSVWCDFDRDGDLDLMVAKCRQFISDPYDPRRTNILLVNDGSNNYGDQAGARGLINLQQSWTADFADVDNDGDFDCFLTTHSGTLELYANDGFGYFTNITAGSGLDISGFFLQAKLEDFDNDGFVDLLYSGGVQGYMKNNGDNTFTPMNNMFPAADVMHAFGIGDLNNDGWLDVYCNYGDSYVSPDNINADRTYLNDGGDNNWVRFDLEGTISNKSAVGALVEIHGAWGVQIREVRAGESYGISNSLRPHFGLGSATSIDYAVVYWPAGGIQVIENPSINSTIALTEADCTAPTANIAATGSTSICEGQSVTIEVTNANSNYIWNTGSTNSSIQADTQGNYSLIAYDNEGCGALSNVIAVDIAQVETPTIAIGGPLDFCQGESVQLIASSGTSYLWNNGVQTQSLEVTEPGFYSVQVQGLCGMAASETIEVIVYSAPSAPVVNDITINSAGSATFNYSGLDVRWYNAEDATTPVGTGNSYTTPTVNSTTSYWVEDVMIHGGLLGEGGKMVNESSTYGQYHNSSSFFLKFNANEDILINTVKVFAGNAGDRTIQVVDANLAVIATGTFAIPQGESVVTLSFVVPAGTGYGLRCTDSNPQLWRDKNLDVAAPFGFPYDVNGLATITGTTVAGNDSDNYYYFFYDWNVQTPEFECPSPRTEVQLIIAGISELSGVNNMVIYPNPANDQITIRYRSTENSSMVVRVFDQVGRIVATERMTNSIGTNNFQMDVSHFAAGVYQIQFEKNGKAVSQRFVVE